LFGIVKLVTESQDHITGISNILQEASHEAKLVISPIIQQEKFLEYIAIGLKEKVESTAEFGKVIDFIKKNSSRVIVPITDKIIFPYKENDIEVYTLSPNDVDLYEYIAAIMLPDERRKTSYSFPESNNLSIVMLVKFGTDGILLGSDLENAANINSGWKKLVSSYRYNNRLSLVKIPHHGSSDAHNDDLWENILCDKPLSVVTVFNKSVPLPKNSDIDRLRALSQALFVVGEKTKKDRKLENHAKKVLHDVKIKSIPTKIGLSRFRRSIGDDEWTVETFGAVTQIWTRT